MANRVIELTVEIVLTDDEAGSKVDPQALRHALMAKLEGMADSGGTIQEFDVFVDDVTDLQEGA